MCSGSKCCVQAHSQGTFPLHHLWVHMHSGKNFWSKCFLKVKNRTIFPAMVPKKKSAYNSSRVTMQQLKKPHEALYACATHVAISVYLPVPSVFRSLGLYLGLQRYGRTACWCSRAAPDVFVQASPSPNQSPVHFCPRLLSDIHTLRARVYVNICTIWACALLQWRIMEKEEEVAELQQLRSTLSLTYGPLGVYVILYLHAYFQNAPHLVCKRF